MQIGFDLERTEMGVGVELLILMTTFAYQWPLTSFAAALATL